MLINLRNALMAGKRLPYDAEVEYLQSSGTQYIDTLVNADSNLSVEITMANAGTPWTNINPTGAILATPRHRHHLNFNNGPDTNGVNYFLGNGDNCIAASGYKPADGEIFTFKVDAISKTFTLGSFLSTFPNDTFDTGLSYWLFGRNGTTPPQLGSLRICSAKLWNGSTLVRDFIPVRKGTVGYLYDRVSGKLFGNAGTGDFVVGPDVVPVEYIESHGTEYIDTGVKGRDGYDFEYRFRPIGPLPCGIGGEYEDNKNCYIGLVRSNGNLAYNYFTPNVITEVQSLALGTDYTVKAHLHSGEQYFEVNGVRGGIGSKAGSFVSNFSLYVFAINSNNQPVFNANMRLYSLKIYLNGTLVRDYIPVRKGTVGYLYDRVSGRLFGNAGTGAFVLGPDKARFHLP